MVPSKHPEIIYFPSGEKQTELTKSSCPYRDRDNFPVYEFQILMVLSSDPEIIYFPSGEKQTEVTPLSCPIRSGLMEKLTPFRQVLTIFALIKLILVKLTFVKFAWLKLVSWNIPEFKLAFFISILLKSFPEKLYYAATNKVMLLEA